VGAVRTGADARVQAGGQDVDHQLVLATGLGGLDGLVTGRAVEGADDGSVHGSLSK
jgi:hypothetical protein